MEHLHHGVGTKVLRHQRHRLGQVVEHQRQHRLGSEAEDVRQRHRRNAQTRSVDQDELVHPLGMKRGKLRADPAAERDASHTHGFMQSQPIKQVKVVEHHIVHAGEPVRQGRWAKAGMVGQEHLEVLGKPVDPFGPHSCTQGAVQEEERVAVARCENPHAIVPG